MGERFNILFHMPNGSTSIINQFRLGDCVEIGPFTGRGEMEFDRDAYVASGIWSLHPEHGFHVDELRGISLGGAVFGQGTVVGINRQGHSLIIKVPVAGGFFDGNKGSIKEAQLEVPVADVRKSYIN
jgi:hypothetical protein